MKDFFVKIKVNIFKGRKRSSWKEGSKAAFTVFIYHVSNSDYLCVSSSPRSLRSIALHIFTGSSSRKLLFFYLPDLKIQIPASNGKSSKRRSVRNDEHRPPTPPPRIVFPLAEKLFPPPDTLCSDYWIRKTRLLC